MMQDLELLASFNFYDGAAMCQYISLDIIELHLQK
jgi:hypothetical protein